MLSCKLDLGIHGRCDPEAVLRRSSCESYTETHLRPKEHNSTREFENTTFRLKQKKCKLSHIFRFLVERAFFFFFLAVHLVGGNRLSYAASPDAISLPVRKQHNSLTVLIPAASLRSRQTGVSRQVRRWGH